jgi:predicted SprT family Zn-dependent metalloprotease
MSDDYGMKQKKTKLRAAALTYDLFQHETLAPPAPATLYTKIMQDAARPLQIATPPPQAPITSLPTIAELYRIYDELNWLYWGGKLPAVTIKYSPRMLSAGSYTPRGKLIKLGSRYHEIFPHELVDTLKHEMIHILHFYHDAKFKAEAERVGTTVKATFHPSLRRSPRFIYECPNCRREYPRHKRMRMHSCGKCSGGRFNIHYKLRLKTQ